MYVPLIAMVPTVALPPANPFTSHVKAVPLATQKDAVKVWVCPSETVAVAGEIELIPEHEIVTLAPPDFVASATLVAVTVTIAGAGGATGAV